MPRRYILPTRVSRGIEVLAAIAVLTSTWVTVEGGLAGYPTWLYLGTVTAPTFLVAPTVLALVVLARWSRSRRSRAGASRARQTLATVAALTLLVSAYAVWTVNVSTPGVYWAGFFPLVTGVLLACGVLLIHATRVRRQFPKENTRSS